MEADLLHETNEQTWKTGQCQGSMSHLLYYHDAKEAQKI